MQFRFKRIFFIIFVITLVLLILSIEIYQRQLLDPFEEPLNYRGSIITEIDSIDNIIIESNASGNTFDLTKNTENIAQEALKSFSNTKELQLRIDQLLESTNTSRQKLKSYKEANNFHYGKELYISTNGNNNNHGTIDKPFATLTGARNFIREYRNTYGLPHGGIVVWIREGRYSLETTFRLKGIDSGMENSPIAYRAYNNEKVTFIGGRILNSSNFTKVTSNDPVWDRLNISARPNIFVTNLKHQDIKEFGVLQKDFYSSIAPVEIFENNSSLTLARWPNINDNTDLPSLDDDEINLYGDLNPDVTGLYVRQNTDFPLYKLNKLVDDKQYYISRAEGKSGNSRRIWSIHEQYGRPLWSQRGLGYNLPKEFKTSHLNSKGIPSLFKDTDIRFGFAVIKEGIDNTTFRYSGENPKKWLNDGTLWINGMLKYAWANRHVKIKNIDIKEKIISLVKPPLYGISKGKYRKSYFVYNVLEELDSRGEYYLDRSTLNLYIWPKNNIDNTELTISLNDNHMIDMDNTSWLEFHNITMQMGRKSIINIKEGNNNTISNCILRYSGKSLINISGIKNGIKLSTLTGSGEEAINISGGDRASLISSKNFVINNHIYNNNRWNWTSKGAVKLSGVGSIIEYNDIHGLMHQAINFGGNNHSIQYNNIYDILTFAEDAGAIYAGRNLGYRGNKVNYNFIHDIKNNYGGSMMSAIYFDDTLSGNEAIGNIIYNIDGNGIFMNGGSYNKIEENIFHKVATAYVGTNYGLKRKADILESLKQDNVNYKSKIWVTAYPELSNMPNDWLKIKNNKLLAPKNNSFKNNISGYNLRWTRGPYTDNFEHYSFFEEPKLLNITNIIFTKIGIQIK